MSFGRWLLVNSFTIILLILFFLGYVYRSELQLENAFNQLLNIEPVPSLSLPDSSKPSSTVKKQEATEQKGSDVKMTSSPVIVEDKEIDKVVPSNLTTVPTVSTVPTPKIESVEIQGEINQLYLARQAYWDKNYADAIYFYRQLIQQNRNNPDYLGELGNIYYSLNDNQNASKLYYQAAILFLNHNQRDRAQLLVAPIIAMNRELGEKLKLDLQ